MRFIIMFVAAAYFMFLRMVLGAVASECLHLLCRYLNANFPFLL